MVTYFVKEITVELEGREELDLQYQKHVIYPMLVVNGNFYVADDWGCLNKKQHHQFKIARVLENGTVWWMANKKSRIEGDEPKRTG